MTYVLICTLLNTVHSTVIIIISKHSIRINGRISVPISSCYVSCPFGSINGTVTWTSLTEGGVATYVCDDGFELEGNMTRTCESSGMWRGEEPMCRGMLSTPFV